METKVIKHENSITTVTVKIEKEKWSEKQKKALERLAKKVQIKGFRKGGAPIDLVKKHVSQYDILNEAAQISLNDGLNEAIKQNNISYYDVKNVNISKISDAELELVYNIITNPTCTLGQYKGLDVALPKVSVTKDEIQETLANEKLEEDATIRVTAMDELRKKYGMDILDSDLKEKYSNYIANQIANARSNS